MNHKINILIISIALSIIGCNSKEKKEVTNEENVAISTEEKINQPENLIDYLEALPRKTIPLTDSTNFDNIKNKKNISSSIQKVLQLKEIYKNIDKDGYNFKFYPSYKLNLSDEFHTIVLNVFKGDHELEALLINYDLQNKLVNHKVIAYDEIAEGWSRKFSHIDNNIITVIDETYMDNKKTETNKFGINKFGEINPIQAKFSSDLRPDKPIVLNQIYTDTIEFTSYDDNGDYFILEGKKEENNVSLIYNWEWNNNDKYKFNHGELIKVRWKMDSIFIAGEGEMLAFRERAIDAEKIETGIMPIQFLWRADTFEEETKQNVNSIFINEVFSSSISDQEKAALGYVATFMGNDCYWDGEADESRSNLKCKILAVLDLGYQCSDKHLGFLKKWFSKDADALKSLEKCRTMPYTATVQTTFDEISILTSKEAKTITISYKANGINMRASIKWSWTQTDIFEFNSENIKLISSKKTEEKEGVLEMSEN